MPPVVGSYVYGARLGRGVHENSRSGLYHCLSTSWDSNVVM